VSIPGLRGWTALSRRVRTLIVSGIAFFALLIVSFTMPVPYAVLGPGPTCNTLGAGGDAACGTASLITINGVKTNAVSGHLNLTTVSVTEENHKETVFDVLSAWLSSNQVVIPKSAEYPPGQSQNQVDQQNAADFTESQDSAVAAASCELGYPKRYGVQGVESTGASFQKLLPADIITSVDGTPTSGAAALTAALAPHPQGSTVTLGIVREAKPMTVSVKLGKPIKTGGNGSLGISLGTVCQFPFSVSICSGCEIGGPSAGLMFALGIMDKVGKVDLTHGMFIAGTGEIDGQGNVLPIGGIALKMIGARDAGATVFLAPAGNCSDVAGAIPKGLDVIKVTTLHDAVTSLEALHAGKSVPHC
jgi:PDZ domain-containing protein